jgi:HD superfamily phosphodiesterase
MNFDYTSLASIDPRLPILFEILQPEYKKMGESHGIQHHLGVLKYCIKIGRKEKVNLKIAGAASLVHDYGLSKDIGGTFNNHSLKGSRGCVPFLKKAGYKDDEIEGIQHCVAAHNVRYEGIEPALEEAKCVIDADTICKIDEGSNERAKKYMEETRMSEKDFAERWVQSREKLIREGKLWWTKTGQEIGQPLLEKALEYWKGKM